MDRENKDDDSVSCGNYAIEEDNTPAIRLKSIPNTDICVTQNDIEKYGATPGCPACRHILDSTKIPRGIAHSAICRKNIRNKIELDEDPRDRVERADQ